MLESRDTTARTNQGLIRKHSSMTNKPSFIMAKTASKSNNLLSFLNFAKRKSKVDECNA